MNDAKFYSLMGVLLTLTATVAGGVLTLAGLPVAWVTSFVGTIMGLASLMLTQQRTSDQKMVLAGATMEASDVRQQAKDGRIREIEQVTGEIRSSLVTQDINGVKTIAKALREVANITNRPEDVQAAEDAEKNAEEFAKAKLELIEKQSEFLQRSRTPKIAE